MTAINANPVSAPDISLTASAVGKMNELLQQVEDDIEGVRVFATPGGCSGMTFGMTFTDQLAEEDNTYEFGDCKVIVDNGTLEHIRGVEIDFSDADGGEPRFVFNNLQPAGGGGCGTCGSASGGCG